jgi:hypothetical protein
MLAVSKDIEHFMSHEAIEDEEDEKLRHFTGEDSDLPAAGTPEGAALTPEEVAQHVFNELNDISDEATTPEEQRFIHNVEAAEDRNAAKPQVIEPKQKVVPPPRYNPNAAAAASAVASAGQSKAEAYAKEEKARQDRAAAARAQAEKFKQSAKDARGSWGDKTEEMVFAKPKDLADRMRSNIPYK